MKSLFLCAEETESNKSYKYILTLTYTMQAGMFHFIIKIAMQKATNIDCIAEKNLLKNVAKHTKGMRLLYLCWKKRWYWWQLGQKDSRGLFDHLCTIWNADEPKPPNLRQILNVEILMYLLRLVCGTRLSIPLTCCNPFDSVLQSLFFLHFFPCAIHPPNVASCIVGTASTWHPKRPHKASVKPVRLTPI